MKKEIKIVCVGIDSVKTCGNPILRSDLEWIEGATYKNVDEIRSDLSLDETTQLLLISLGEMTEWANNCDDEMNEFNTDWFAYVYIEKE